MKQKQNKIERENMKILLILIVAFFCARATMENTITSKTIIDTQQETSAETESKPKAPLEATEDGGGKHKSWLTSMFKLQPIDTGNFINILGIAAIFVTLVFNYRAISLSRESVEAAKESVETAEKSIEVAKDSVQIANKATQMNIIFDFYKIWFGEGKLAKRKFLYSAFTNRLEEVITANRHEKEQLFTDQAVTTQERNLLLRLCGIDVDNQKRQEKLIAFHGQINGEDGSGSNMESLETVIADLEILGHLYKRGIGEDFVKEFAPVIKNLSRQLLTYIYAEQKLRNQDSYKVPVVALICKYAGDEIEDLLDDNEMITMKKWLNDIKEKHPDLWLPSESITSSESEDSD